MTRRAREVGTARKSSGGRHAPVARALNSGVDSRPLVERLREGDERAFDQAYTEHRAALFSYLLRASRDRPLAEELLQETFLRFATHARSLDEDTDLRAWLFTVARNLFRSRKRRDLFGRELLRQLGFVARDTNQESPFENALASETERRLERALDQLSPAHRDVILLAVVERLELDQVAKVLGLRPEATRQRLSRARAMLAELLEPSSDPIGEPP